MRIIFLTGSLETGGLERFVTRVSVTAKKENLFDPTVICLHHRTGIFLRELEDHEIPVLEAPLRWQRNFWSLIRLARLIQSTKAEVVHSQVNFSLFQQWIATRLFSRALFLVTERNSYPLAGWSLFRRRLQFYGLRGMGVCYSANSSEVANHLANLMQCTVSSIPVIPNGLDVPTVNPEAREQIRHDQRWHPSDFVVGYVSRFAAHKGHLYFLQVMQVVHRQLGDRLKICFIGDGPQRPFISEEAKRLNLSHLISYQGVIPNVTDYYQSFDCAALLSDYEGMPNVVLEAMACGLPVVANPVGNVRTLFQNGAGLVNEDRVPEHTASLFLRLANDPSAASDIGRLARQTIKTSFSLDHTLNLLLAYYDRRK